MQRSLTLRKDTLSELTASELGGVVGGSAGPTCQTCVDCVKRMLEEQHELPAVTSVNAPCQTG